MVRLVNPVTRAAMLDELEKISAAKKLPKIKSNDRMPARTKANISHLVGGLASWDSPHREKALELVDKVSPEKLFDVLHSMRRWYSGQTMARNLLANRDTLSSVMQLEPKDAVGVYRGFKVPKDHPLASLQVGQQLTLPVTRNHGFSSWSLTEAPTHKFSGGGKGKVGLIIKLVDSKGITPVLAPPTHTHPWFNELYARAIGSSFRPKEEEYLISAPEVKVEVVRVKR